MKKSLIAMSVAAVVAAPMAANAAGTVYGQLQAEISSSDAGVQMIDNARGRIGFKGSEELGNGMTMIGKMEFKVDTADGDADTADKGAGTAGISLTKREMMVGLKTGDFTISMGRLKSPYKYAGGVKYDPFVTTTLEARGVTMSGKVGTGKAMGHFSFMSDMLGVSALGGNLNIVYGAGDLDTASGDFAISYKHSMGKNEIIVAHVAQGDSGDYTATKIGGKFAGVKVQYEMTDTGAVNGEGTNLFIGYGMKAAGGTVVIQGGMTDSDTAVDGVTDVTLGYIKKFTKSSRWFGGVRSITGDTEDSIATVGLRFDY